MKRDMVYLDMNLNCPAFLLVEVGNYWLSAAEEKG